MPIVKIDSFVDYLIAVYFRSQTHTDITRNVNYAGASILFMIEMAIL